jgi:acetyltransferase-like isoleucine patch superfamily enzyme
MEPERLAKFSCYSKFHSMVNVEAGIQDTMRSPGKSALQKYQDLVVGSRSLLRLAVYEAVMLCASWVPGGLGLLLRRLGYRRLLASVGRNVTFGQGVVLRHPGKIRLGDNVVVDDLVVLDAKGTSNEGITVGSNVFLGRGTILSCKNGDIVLGDNVNIGFHSEVFSGSSVRVGAYGLFAAYTYLVGGGHASDEPTLAVLEQPRPSRGIVLGENVWLGTGAKVLDGVSIGRDVIVGANAVVLEDLPDGAVAAGVPARILRRRAPDAGGRGTGTEDP